MSRFKFLHGADIHLDSPLRGLERYEGAPADRIRGATRRALENLVDLALEEGVAFVLVAGDVFDGDWRDYNTGLFYAAQVGRLAARSIPVLQVKGNHDAESRVSHRLRTPSVHTFPAGKPDTVRFEDLQAAVHGRSFAERVETANLAASYPPPVAGWFNIGVLHTSAEGVAGHDTAAPCSVRGLAGHGYDYWALGHIHQRTVLSRDPWIVFPGNLQGRHARETQDGGKGCTLVSVEDGRVTGVEHRALDTVRWARCTVDATAAASATEAVDAALASLKALLRGMLPAAPGTEAPLVAARVVLQGPTDAHRALLSDPARWAAELRSRVLSEGLEEIWVEKVLFETTSPSGGGGPEASPLPLADLESFLDRAGGDAAFLEELLSVNDLVKLREVLPHELKTGEDPLDLSGPDLVTGRMEAIRQTLLSRLSTEGGRE
ncbi:MAG: DNA repair exonuclease [Acidobacteria bacterium]|nr:DNA repair exonuclease [Acidobacteriota bacterium]